MREKRKLTVGQLLLQGEKYSNGDIRNRLKGHDDIRCIQREIEESVKNENIPDIAERIYDYIEEMLDIDLQDLFLKGWKQYTRVQKTLNESKKDPKKNVYLALSKHTIVSKHHPYIEVDLNEKAIRKIIFDITLKFMLEGFILEIRGGTIMSVGTGDCRGSVKISLDDIVLFEKKSKKLELPGKIEM